ncbi:MAG: hypothetical protein R3C53_26515 [Pirellulaceae bacterium]
MNEQLAKVAKHQFWIFTGVGVLLGIVGFYLASSTLSDMYAKQKTALDTSFQSISTVSSAMPTHPNDLSQARMQEIIDAAAVDVQAAWEVQYNRQVPILQWPNNIGSPDLVRKLKGYQPVELKLEFPAEPPNVTDAEKQIYATYFDKQMKALGEIIGVEWVGEVSKTADAGGGMMGGMGGYGDMGGMGSMGDMGGGYDDMGGMGGYGDMGGMGGMGGYGDMGGMGDMGGGYGDMGGMGDMGGGYGDMGGMGDMGGGYGDMGGYGGTTPAAPKPIDTQDWQTRAARRLLNQITQKIHVALDGKPLKDESPVYTYSFASATAGNAELQQQVTELVDLLDEFQEAINDAVKIEDIASILDESKTPIENIMDFSIEVPGFLKRYPELADDEEDLQKAEKPKPMPNNGGAPADGGPGAPADGQPTGDGTTPPGPADANPSQPGANQPGPMPGEQPGGAQ